MTPELGHFALILALCIAIVQTIFPMAGTFLRKPGWIALGRTAAWGQFVFVAIAFAGLAVAFLQNDFSVKYVATNSNTLLPDIFKFSAIWGGHEGSLLLWMLMLSGWSVAIAIFSRSLPNEVVARVLSVMGFVSIGFLLFILFTSNPFDRLLPAAAEGRDLNPLLQDFGLVIHPPLLYMGYVGFSVAFSFAISALISGKLDAAWARWSRPWTTVAWVFLTLGIMLGSWWAYYELGWGGWWFWDPVENASFMPWLVGTALIHSLAVAEKRGAFKSWTVLLAISAFSLSLLGTFLVRSGVLTSVHAFATDPTRGVYILAFLITVIGGSLIIYAWRAPSVAGGGRFDLLSRESLLLGNNLLFLIMTIVVLFGTLAPLIYDAFGWGKISVGFPWFNFMFVVLTPFLILIMGLGPIVRWKQHDPAELVRQVRWIFLLSLTIAVLFSLPLFLPEANFKVSLGVGLASWIIMSLFLSIKARLHNKKSISAIWRDMNTQGRSFYGMVLAHFGMAVTIIGITFVSIFDVENDIRLSPGESKNIAGYEFIFKGVKSERGPNYQASIGDFAITKNGKVVANLRPEKRDYFSQTMPMTEAGIDAGFTRDLYVSLGEPLGEGSWSMRLYYKPFVRWIWLGAIFMALGGLLAISDRRYRLKIKQKSALKLTGSEAKA